MKQTFLLLLFAILSVIAFSQEPFDVPSVDYKNYKTIDFSTNFIGDVKTMPTSTIKNDPVVFNQQSLNFSINGSSENILPSANLNLIKYRLRVFSKLATRDNYKKEYLKGDTIRYYLPLIIQSNLSSNYDSTNLTSMLDATSFVGSPFTFRLMPSYDIFVGLENVLTIGHISDLRAIMIKDSLSNKLMTEFGYYGAIGIKYRGKGEVREVSGLSYDGNWSISFLVYLFKGTENLNNYFHLENKKTTTGLELLFKFRLIDTKMTNFNISASAKYQFNTPDKISPYVFKIGFGN